MVKGMIKLCPLLSKVVTDEDGDSELKIINCYQVACGFWDNESGQCAIASLGGNLDTIRSLMENR
jgi:hypothetical protein